VTAGGRQKIDSVIIKAAHPDNFAVVALAGNVLLNFGDGQKIIRLHQARELADDRDVLRIGKRVCQLKHEAESLSPSPQAHHHASPTFETVPDIARNWG
jgi:hypothetical protein